jgi:hypothetical protein
MAPVVVVSLYCCSMTWLTINNGTGRETDLTDGRTAIHASRGKEKKRGVCLHTVWFVINLFCSYATPCSNFSSYVIVFTVMTNCDNYLVPTRQLSC